MSENGGRAAPAGPVRPALFPALVIGGGLLAVVTLGGALLPFILGLLLALAAAPVSEALVRRGLGRGLAAGAGAALANLAAFASLAGLAWLLAQAAMTMRAVLPELWPRLLDRAAELLPPRSLSGVSREPPALLADPLAAVIDGPGSLIVTLVSLTGSAAGLVLLVLLTPFVTYFLLRDAPALSGRAAALLSDRQAGEIRAFWARAKPRLAAALGGQLIISVIQAALFGAGYLALGLQWAVPLALFNGFARLVPVLGGAAGFALALTAGLLQFEAWWPLLVIAGVHAAVEVIEVGVLSPYIIGRRTQIHPLLVLATVLIGAALFGLLGMLIAIPLAAVIGVLLDGLARARTVPPPLR